MRRARAERYATFRFGVDFGNDTGKKLLILFLSMIQRVFSSTWCSGFSWKHWSRSFLDDLRRGPRLRLFQQCLQKRIRGV